MLAFKDKNEWRRWHLGERLPNGLAPSPNAEAVMTDDELLTVGLYRVTDEAVPEGKVATAWALADEKGAPVNRPTLADQPPPPSPPTPAELAAQFDRIEGKTTTVELVIRAVISLLADRMGATDAQAKAAVRNRMQAIAEGTRG